MPSSLVLLLLLLLKARPQLSSSPSLRSEKYSAEGEVRFETLRKNLVSPTRDSVQVEAAHSLIRRLLPETVWTNVSVTVQRSLRTPEGNDLGQLDVTATGHVKITASSGVTAAWVLNHYLKYWCHCHVSWDLRQLKERTASGLRVCVFQEVLFLGEVLQVSWSPALYGPQCY